jgi:alpha-beta hydrolase superfamily lysophospholipase
LTAESTLSTYTASEGDNLAVQDWPLPEGVAQRGLVVLVHGLGEHAGRYDHVAERLNSWGYAVRGYDQYGHGESDGVRGALPKPGRLLDDLADVISNSRKRMAQGAPLIVLGHSMGGLVASYLVALGRAPIDGLVLSSPALNAGLSAFQKMLLAAMLRIAPNLSLGNGVNPNYISHDPQVVAAYKNDPRVHDRISAHLADFIAQGGPRVVAAAKDWQIPTLVMYAGADKLLNPEGSRDFLAGAPPGVVSSRCFENLYHEIFNEPDSEPVFDTLRAWLEQHF